MSGEMARPDDGSFYVEGGKLWQAPRKTKGEDGTTRITLGFPVATPSEWVDERAMETIARVWNAHDDMLAALIAAERLFEHTFAMNGTVHKQMKAAIAKAEEHADPEACSVCGGDCSSANPPVYSCPMKPSA